MRELAGRDIRTMEAWSFFYDETPGHAPAGSRGIAVGTAVNVAPSLFRGQHWAGVVKAHMHGKNDGNYLGLSVVTVTDPRGFLNLQAGENCQAEIKDISAL